MYFISFDAGSTWHRLKLITMPKISYTKESGQYYFVKKTDSWKFNKSENSIAYDILKSLLSDVSLVYYEILVKIDVYSNFTDYDFSEFVGYVPLSGLRMDESTGVVFIDPTTKDLYSWLDTYGETKIPWKDITSDVSSLNSVGYSVLSQSNLIFSNWKQSITFSPIAPGGYIECSELPDVWDGNGRHYHAISTYTGTNPNSHTGYGDGRSFCMTYVNGNPHVFCCIHTHTSYPGGQPIVGQYTGEWVEVGMNGSYINGFTYRSYIQQQTRVPVPGYVSGDGTYDTGFPYITEILEYSTNCDTGTYYHKGLFPETKTWNYGQNFMELKSLLSYFLTTTRNSIQASGMSVVSDFFTLATNPLSGASPNPFSNINVSPTGYVMPGVGMSMGEVIEVSMKSVGSGYSTGDIVRVVQGTNQSCYLQVSETSPSGGIVSVSIMEVGYGYTDGSNLVVSGGSGSGGRVNVTVFKYQDLTSEYCLKEILTDICSTFDCFYYINNSNELVIEHQKFFENQFSYSGGSYASIDLTNKSTYPVRWQTIEDADGTASDASYGWNGIRIPKFEKFNYQQSNMPYAMIEYESPLAVSSDTENHDVQLFSGDLELMGRTPDKHSDSGMIIICCDSNNYVIKRDAVIEDILVSDVMNGDLYWDNLLNDYWKYYRYFKSGYVNRGTTYTIVFHEKTLYESRGIKTFTQRRLKTQRQISLPCLAQFDPYGLVKTNMGNGLIKEAELDTDTDFIKVTLMY